MHVRVAIGDIFVITKYVKDELPQKSGDSEGSNTARSTTATSESPRRATSPETPSESASKRAHMPEAFSDQVLMAEFWSESRVLANPEWSDSDHDAINAGAVSESHGCQPPGSPSRNPGILPISVHLSQKDEGAEQALFWESASAATAASKEELRFAGVLAPKRQFSPESWSSDNEAQDPVFDPTRQPSKEVPYTVFKDAALNLADLVAEFSEDPLA